MNFDNIKEKIINFLNNNLSERAKVYTTLSLAWIIFIGYLTWWNGLKSFAVDKSFRWDEWFWFGVVPAITPYFFYFIWKKRD
jgi:hypothetical protein|tara:strand:+ start:902 stop:1147 length:246 start_codon:yes stop_codon:yes gene_type:complete